VKDAPDFHIGWAFSDSYPPYLQYLKKVFHFSAADRLKAMWTKWKTSGVPKFSLQARHFPQVFHNRVWTQKAR
jgi:hypothetical protein